MAAKTTTRKKTSHQKFKRHTGAASIDVIRPKIVDAIRAGGAEGVKLNTIIKAMFGDQNERDFRNTMQRAYYVIKNTPEIIGIGANQKRVYRLAEFGGAPAPQTRDLPARRPANGKTKVKAVAVMTLTQYMLHDIRARLDELEKLIGG